MVSDSKYTEKKQHIYESEINTKDLSAVEEALQQMDAISALPEKRMCRYFNDRISLLNPLIQSSLCYYLEPYYIDDTLLTISRIDASEVMSYLKRRKHLLSLSCDSETRKRFFGSPEYYFNKLTERQQEIARINEPFADDIVRQIEAEKIAIEAYKKETADMLNRLVKEHDAFISRCSHKTQSVIRYEECRKDPGRGTSGFHGFGNAYPLPFSMCGWATFDGVWGGVAFRINRDCFDGRDAVLYYMDDDYFGDMSEHNKEWLRKMIGVIERYSSGLTDIKICEKTEPDTFTFRGHAHYPARVTTIQFRLDSSKIKDTVEICEKPVPTPEIGEYIFVLPKAGEFYIELGEILDGERVPLHYDDFCMK